MPDLNMQVCLSFWARADEDVVKYGHKGEVSPEINMRSTMKAKFGSFRPFVCLAAVAVGLSAFALPAGYTRVSCIEGTGGYALTDYVPRPTEDEIEFTFASVNNAGNNILLFSSRLGDASVPDGFIGAFYYGGERRMRFDYNRTEAQVTDIPSYRDETIYTLVLKDGVLAEKHGGVLASQPHEDFTPTNGVCIFAQRQGKDTANIGRFRFYRMKVTRNGEVIHDFVPVKNASDVGMIVDDVANPATVQMVTLNHPFGVGGAQQPLTLAVGAASGAEKERVSQRYRTPGIIGGMGPSATCDLMQKIIDNTDAGDDQHNIHLLVDQNTDVPDRTAAILKGGADPMPELTKSAKRLEAAGADFLCMSCNTAHYFHERLSKQVGIPILNMPAESAQELKRRGVRKVGLLATDGTIRTGVYHRYLKEAGIEVVVPEGEDQKTVMSLIYDCVKKNVPVEKYPKEQVARTVANLKAKGAEAYLLACTELPIAFERLGYREGFVDPTLVLARAIIREAGAPLRK